MSFDKIIYSSKTDFYENDPASQRSDLTIMKKVALFNIVKLLLPMLTQKNKETESQNQVKTQLQVCEVSPP